MHDEKQPLSARILVSVFLAPFLLVSGLLLVSPFRTLAGAAWTYAWQPVECQIVESSVEQTDGLFAFRVSYHYRAEGKEHTGHVYARGYEPTANPLAAESLVAALPKGAEGLCYVNPLDAGDAVVERGDVGMTASDLLISFLAGAIFFAPLAFAFYAIHFGASFARLTSDPKFVARGIVSVLAGGFLFVGAVLFLTFVWEPAALVLDASSWTETNCTIVRAQVVARETTVRRDRTAPGQPTTTSQTVYGLDLEYTYRAGGRELTGTRYRFFSQSAGRAANQAIADRYSPGQVVRCHHATDDPSSVVLETSVGREVLWAAAPLLFLAVGVGLGIWSRKIA